MNIGIVGAAGGMGKAYASRFATLGHTVFVSDRNVSDLHKAYEGVQNIVIMPTNQDVARRSDLLIYSITPLGSIDQVIKECIGAVKPGSIVGGFTSVKTKEVAALQQYAPSGVQIVSMHPMHGPSLDPKNQTFILVPVRVEGDSTTKKLEELLRPLGPKVVYLTSSDEHDKITADTQVLTHFTLFTMGDAWRRLGITPSAHPTYQNPIDDLKALMTQRLLSQNLDVYTGIAVENPEARRQVREYVESLHGLMQFSIMARDSKAALSHLRGFAGAPRDYLGRDKIREAEETLEALFGKKLDFKDNLNSQTSLIAKGITWAVLGINPSENLAFKSPPYEILSLMTHAVFGRGFETFLRNMISNSETTRLCLQHISCCFRRMHIKGG
ncbi:prephenate dehydrogenase [Candidatus Woesearchaeota archaeon]|nr:prephenate dehydrogenase [Candidatus Woesearchaeota archaeon]